MKAITVIPGQAGSAELSEVPEPEPGEGAALVRGLALGICGTDHEILGGGEGEAPPGEQRLVLGHESLGRVVDGAGALRDGDLVVGIVRRPDPEPCACCAAGEWDACRNGRYTERGIKGLHGFGAELWRIEPEFAVVLDPALETVGVLLEPASIVAKAWERIERIAASGCAAPRRVLVTGAGPIGLLAALLSVQRGLETHVLDRAREGAKPRLVRRLGASYHHTSVEEACPDADVVIECTGAPAVVLDAMARNARNGIVCLTGVSPAGRETALDAGALNRRIVLENDVVFGSVNANRRHYEAAARALAAADRSWLESLFSRRVALASWRDALERRPDDVKVVVDLSSDGK